jgi:hypothetical protein
MSVFLAIVMMLSCAALLAVGTLSVLKSLLDIVSSTPPLTGVNIAHADDASQCLVPHGGDALLSAPNAERLATRITVHIIDRCGSSTDRYTDISTWSDVP